MDPKEVESKRGIPKEGETGGTTKSPEDREMGQEILVI